MAKQLYRAYDTMTEWHGRNRLSAEAADADAERHNKACERAGGYGSAIATMMVDGRHAHLDGSPVWPPYGRTCGSARWR